MSKRTRIVNNTDLYYKELGEIMDNISWSNKGDTIYYDKEDLVRIIYKRRKIEIKIRYLKTFTEWKFDFYED